MNKKKFKCFDFMRLQCGCITWKHELNTWLCKSLTDQEIGEAVEMGDPWIHQYYE